MIRANYRKKIGGGIGERLQLLREERHWTRSVMAQKLGVTPSAYTKNESGISIPCFESLKRLAYDFGVSMDWFFFNRGPMYFPGGEGDGGDKKSDAVVEELGGYSGDEIREAGLKYLDCKKKMPDMEELLEAMAGEPRLRYALLFYYCKLKESPAEVAPQIPPAVQVQPGD